MTPRNSNLPLEVLVAADPVVPFLDEILALGNQVEVRVLPEKIFVAALKGTLDEPTAQAASLTVETVNETLAKADIILGWRAPAAILTKTPSVKWVQFLSAGVDGLFDPAVLESGVLLTDVSGIAARPIAQFAFMFMLMIVRQAPRMILNQENRNWARIEGHELQDRTVGVVGLGSIGSEVAKLTRAFDMGVVATNRSATTRISPWGDVDTLYPRSELGEMLAVSDFVVVTAPLTPETNKMIGRAELAAMKPSAHLINVSRGGLVDQEALVQALRKGQIAGAALDVFDREPLPQESELWGMPNVIVTPHIAGVTERYHRRVVQFFCTNLRRYLAGQALVNVVERDKGY